MFFWIDTIDVIATIAMKMFSITSHPLYDIFANNFWFYQSPALDFGHFPLKHVVHNSTANIHVIVFLSLNINNPKHGFFSLFPFSVYFQQDWDMV